MDFADRQVRIDLRDDLFDGGRNRGSAAVGADHRAEVGQHERVYGQIDGRPRRLIERAPSRIGHDADHRRAVAEVDLFADRILAAEFLDG